MKRVGSLPIIVDVKIRMLHIRRILMVQTLGQTETIAGFGLSPLNFRIKAVKFYTFFASFFQRFSPRVYCSSLLFPVSVRQSNVIDRVNVNWSRLGSQKVRYFQCTGNRETVFVKNYFQWGGSTGK